jgi:hypothetical protein
VRTEVRRARVHGECKIQSVPVIVSADKHLPWFTEILAKDVPFLILVCWTGKASRLLNLHPPIRKSQVTGVLGANSGTCYTFVKLKFVVAWVQETPTKNTT